MRWVTYLSPAAGTERPALLVDGALHGPVLELRAADRVRLPRHPPGARAM